MIKTTAIVSRPPTARQILDLQKAESCIAWVVSLVAKFRPETKEGKPNADGTLVDLQLRNLFLSVCGQELLKIRSLVQRDQTNNSKLYFSQRKSHNGGNCLRVVRGTGETVDHFLVRQRRTLL